MPPVPPRPILPVNTHRLALMERARQRVIDFCGANDLPVPGIREAERTDWVFGACAYYRPDTKPNRRWGGVGINICLDLCAQCATEPQIRNWNWPGCVTDREPYGVVAHELGHHVDWHLGDTQGEYFSDYGEWIMQHSGEPPITSYAPNPAEWFAEICRLFVTNASLLRLVRPRAWRLLCQKLKPVSPLDWRAELGSNCPPRIVAAQMKKFDRGMTRATAILFS